MIRHRNRILLVVFCCPALLALSASGQINTKVQQESPLTADSQKAIATAIAGEVKAMVGGDAKAREKLVSDTEGHGVTASHDYQTQYASDLVKELTPLLDAKNPLRERLNAAIVIGRAAERLLSAGVDDQFTPLVTTILQDKQPSLAIWGVKAAKYIVASTVQGGGNANPLQDQVIQTVKAFPEVGAIADEAYATFTLAPLTGNNANANVGQLAGAVLPHLVQLIDFRASQYAAGAVPPSPVAVKTFSTFLAVTASPAWMGNQALRNDILRALGSLACAQLQLIANGNNEQELVDAAKSIGETLSVMGRQIPGDTHLTAAGDAIRNIAASTSPTTLTDHCTDLNKALGDLGVAPAGGAGAGSGAGTTPAAQSK